MLIITVACDSFKEEITVITVLFLNTQIRMLNKPFALRVQ